MHLVSHQSESIQWMEFAANFSTDIAEQLHMNNLKEEYWSSNKVNCTQRILKHNDRYTIHDHLEESVWYFALQGRTDSNYAVEFNPPSTTNDRQRMSLAHIFHLQSIQNELFLGSVLQQVHSLWERHVCGVCRTPKLTSLRDGSEYLWFAIFGLLFLLQIEEDWGYKVSGFVPRCHQNVLLHQQNLWMLLAASGSLWGWLEVIGWEL